MKDLRKMYFDWMYELVCDEWDSVNQSYSELLSILDSIEFECSLPMDSNRFEDGVDLRYRFGYENGIDDAEIAHELDNRPCSVLEMMVALAIRIEEQIMSDPDIGNRTGQWFMNMLTSLGLSGMEDNNLDVSYIHKTIDKFLNHKYERNGKGGLFTVQDRNCDMRRTEIWYQAMWYLDEVLKE